MKAIVVFDLPDDFDINSTCVAMDIVDKNNNWATTAERVKPMPSRKENSVVYQGEVNVDIPIDFLEKIHNQGYNYCIHEILGDEE